MIYTFRHYKTTYRETPLLVSLLGVDHAQEPVNRPHGIQLFQWFYCLSGRGEVIIEGKRAILHPGQGFLLYPEVPHSYRAVEGEWKVCFFGLTGYSTANLLKTLGMHESGVYHVGGDEIFRTFQDKILALPPDLTLRRRDRAMSVICYDFLLTLSDHIRLVNTTSASTGNEVVQALLTYLESHYAESFSMDDLAEEVHLSRGYIQTLFKREMQRTIWKELQIIRLSRARIALIQNPNKKVAEIAAECGFDSPSYFGMLFKKETGRTPEQYRVEN